MRYFYRLNKRWATAIFILAFPLLAKAQTAEDASLSKQARLKLAPTLHQSSQLKSSNAYRVAVTDATAFKAWLQEQKLQITVQSIPGNSSTLSLPSINPAQLQRLATCPHITFIDRGNRTPIVEAELKDAHFAVNNIPVVQARFQHLNGDGMVVSVKEDAFDKNDLDFKARVLAPENFKAAYTPHATTMATIIAGAGNSGPRGKGIAPKALLSSSDFTQLLPDNSAALQSMGVSVQNHSYGVGVENYYGLESEAYDRETFQNRQLLHVFSSGNSGDKADATGTYANLTGFANLTGQFKNSKNTLSVGAIEPGKKVGALSSKGPAYDGRIKPELVAYGVGGTSEAAAVVSGVALLVQQAYRDQYNGSLPAASLVKAALINSADDVARPAVDFETGFGNTDALGAVRSILESRFIEASIAQHEELVYTLKVPKDVSQLKVTIVWHDREAAPNAPKALINDLDMQVQQQGTANSWMPWVLSTYPHPDSLAKPAKRGIDRLNNVEQITINTPAAGDYNIVVKGHFVQDKAQEFSIVYEFENETEWLYPALGLSLKAGQLNRLRWQGLPATGQLQLSYKLSQDQEWTVIGETDATAPYFDWLAPDTIAVAQVKLSAAGNSLESERFILTKPLKLSVGYNCEQEAMLHWQPLSGVSQYQVLHVDKAYLEPLTTTADTLIILDKKNRPASDYILVAPLLGDMAGETSDVVAYAQQGIGCYIKSFLPLSFVMDTVQLHLELSSLYQVASVTLERQDQGVFKAAQHISPVSGLVYQLTDPTPKLGSNFYRIRIETTKGQTIYSDTEEAVYANPTFVQVYPNPIPAGQQLQIAIGNDTALIQLTDQLGRVLRETEEDGVIKTLDTTGLQRGLYLIRITAGNGQVLTSRVVVL